MPLLILVLLIVLIAQLGFWDTFGAILGAFGMIVLLILVAGGLVAALLRMMFKRVRR